MLWTHKAQPSESTTKVWESDKLVVDKSTDHDKPHFDLFFTTVSMPKIFSEHELKKALCDTLTRAAWYRLLSTMAN